MLEDRNYVLTNLLEKEYISFSFLISRGEENDAWSFPDDDATFYSERAHYSEAAEKSGLDKYFDPSFNPMKKQTTRFGRTYYSVNNYITVYRNREIYIALDRCGPVNSANDPEELKEFLGTLIEFLKIWITGYFEFEILPTALENLERLRNKLDFASDLKDMLVSDNMTIDFKLVDGGYSDFFINKKYNLSFLFKLKGIVDVEKISDKKLLEKHFRSTLCEIGYLVPEKVDSFNFVLVDLKGLKLSKMFDPIEIRRD